MCERRGGNEYGAFRRDTVKKQSEQSVSAGISQQRSFGSCGVTVEELKQYLKDNKEEILTKIRQRKYKPQPVRRVKIPKENGKMRNLGIPTVVDRVIQQAIVQVLSPIYEKQFSKQWKKAKTRCDALVKLGMPYELAFSCANTRKGYQQICKTRYIQFAINNDRLKKRGLLSLTDHYLKVHTEI